MNIIFKRLAIDMVFALIIFTQITGCATTSPEVLAIQNDPDRYRVFVPSREQIVTNAKIPSISAEHFDLDHINHLRAEIEWVNGYGEIIHRYWTAERGNTYALLALELHPGQKPEAVTLEVTSLGEELLLTAPPASPSPRLGWEDLFGPGPHSGAGGAGLIGFALLLSPFILAYRLLRPEPPGRPDRDSVFVWIADVTTGKTVVGTSPPGARIIFPGSKPQPTPNGKPAD